MRRKMIAVMAGCAVLASMMAALHVASSDGTQSPTASKAAAPSDINVAGSGANEETTVTLTITGAGGTSSTAKPMDVVFALDSSGSMAWNDPTKLRLAAAKTFVDKMDAARDLAGVVSWDTDIDFTWPLTHDFPTVKSKIDTVDNSGGTNLSEGLGSAIAVLDAGKQEGASWVILFLSDGDGTYSHAMAETAAGKGYVIYSIGLGDAVGEAPLKDMANTTGGKYYSTPSADNLQAIFDDIYSAVVISTVPYNVQVVEVTQNYIIDESSFNIPPDSVVTDGAGITTIIWNNIGVLLDGDPDLSADETVTLTFKAKSNLVGSDLDVDVSGSARVNYTDKEGTQAGSVNIPQAKINVSQPNEPPVAKCKPANLHLDSSGQATLVASQVDGGSYDPDGDPITLSVDPSSFDCSDLGQNTVTLTATDDEGASDSCQATVTVMDVSPPQITCPDNVELECPADTSPDNTGEATAVDNCSELTITYSDSVTPGCGNTMTIYRTWTATDSSGNTASCVQTVKVVDTTPPELTIPSDVVVEQEIDGGTVVVLAATATDTCDDDVDVTSNELPVYPVGTTAVTFTATDDCGNETSASMTVTVGGPRDVKEEVRDCLADFADESKRIATAIKAIDKSLDPSLWVDDAHLYCDHGKKVFSEEYKAAKELMYLLKGLPDDAKCSGISLIELEYLGEGTAEVQAYLKDVLLNTFTVSEGETLTVQATEATEGELHPEIRLLVDGGEVTKIHTSCSQPIEIGDIHGDFEITDLEKLYKEDNKSKAVSDEALACVQGAIAKLVKVDRLLALTLVLDAEGTPVVDPKNQDKVDKDLAKAYEELAKGDAERDAGKADKAIQHYRKAWENACHAIKYATKA